MLLTTTSGETIVCTQISGKTHHTCDIYKPFKKIIIRRQHGFKKVSFHCQLFIYVDEITTALDQCLELHAIYMDLSKAFDIVDQNMLIKKTF